jgi:hypothetical protein
MTRVPADGVHAFDDRGDVRLLIRIFDRAACEPLVALKENPDQGARSDRRGRMRRHPFPADIFLTVDVNYGGAGLAGFAAASVSH